MNIEKIKEFISLRQDLYSSGVIGLDVYDDKVQVTAKELIGYDDLQLESRNDEPYPFRVFIIRDGIKIYTIVSTEALNKYFPQLSGYMIEDVDLSGGEEHATA